MKSTHCFPKISHGTYTILQKIVNSLTNVSFFFFLEKMKAFPEKKLKHNIRQRVEKSVVKRKKCLCGKGFQCTVFSNLSELNTLNGIVPATMLKIYSGNWTSYSAVENIQEGWLVVLGFNATLTAKVISWRSVTHMCFLAFSHQY